MRRRLLSAMAVVLVAGCNALQPSRVVVTNNGECIARNIVVEIAGARQSRDALQPGKSVTFVDYADRDGDISLTYEVSGRRVERRFEYVSGYVSVRCNVTIGGKNGPTVRC